MSKFIGKIKATIKTIDRRHGSKILLVGGTVTTIAAVVITAKRSFKVTEIVDTHNEYRDRIEEELPKEEYTEKQRSKAIRKLYFHTGAELAKTYALPVSLELLSITMFYGAFGKERNAKIGYISALNSVTTAFTGYRKAVADKLGEDIENELYYGANRLSLTDMDTNEEKSVVVFDPNGYSVYSRFFDETNTEWQNNPQYNLYWLKCQQNIWNDKLQRDKIVFLNDVYASLNLPKIPEGQYIGWAVANGDDFIDFGIWDGNRERARDFVNGYEHSILLTFPNLSGKSIIDYI